MSFLSSVSFGRIFHLVMILHLVPMAQAKPMSYSGYGSELEKLVTSSSSCPRPLDGAVHRAPYPDGSGSGSESHSLGDASRTVQLLDGVGLASALERSGYQSIEECVQSKPLVDFLRLGDSVKSPDSGTPSLKRIPPPHMLPNVQRRVLEIYSQFNMYHYSHMQGQEVFKNYENSSQWIQFFFSQILSNEEFLYDAQSSPLYNFNMPVWLAQEVHRYVSKSTEMPDAQTSWSPSGEFLAQAMYDQFLLRLREQQAGSNDATSSRMPNPNHNKAKFYGFEVELLDHFLNWDAPEPDIGIFRMITRKAGVRHEANRFHKPSIYAAVAYLREILDDVAITEAMAQTMLQAVPDKIHATPQEIINIMPRPDPMPRLMPHMRPQEIPHTIPQETFQTVTHEMTDSTPQEILQKTHQTMHQISQVKFQHELKVREKEIVQKHNNLFRSPSGKGLKDLLKIQGEFSKVILMKVMKILLDPPELLQPQQTEWGGKASLPVVHLGGFEDPDFMKSVHLIGAFMLHLMSLPQLPESMRENLSLTWEKEIECLLAHLNIPINNRKNNQTPEVLSNVYIQELSGYFKSKEPSLSRAYILAGPLACKARAQTLRNHSWPKYPLK